ncbi:substrate-binding domain-containing protein [Kitasatospora sp. NPDC008115]|uniref:substrate-binding domain-containing protein n=1 Tax=Kitasatospora sp. NPDC008115 TaxID=3364022 RepID=UPI0036ED0947
MRSTAARVMTGLVTAVCAVGVLAPAAVADPPPGVVPAAIDLVGVGADTTQGFMNRTSNDYDATVTPGQPRLFSWDATGPSPITTKTGAPFIARPDGSLAGFNALVGTTSSTVDYVRSARQPAVDPSPQPYLFVPFARDAVTWAAKSGGHAPANLSTNQLRSIYQCTVTNWTQLDPSWINATIKPVLPQPNSDTRAAFLKAIGGGTPVTPGACVTSGPRNDRGTDPLLNDDDVVFPYSVGVYVDQVYRGHGTGAESPGLLTLRAVNGIAPVDSLTNSISPAFAATVYGRMLWHAFRTAEYTATTARGVALRRIFGPASGPGWICGHPAVITGYGFLTVPNCGTSVYATGISL